MTKHEMHILDQTGHSTTSWDPDVPDEVEGARSMFTTMTGKGYRAFTVSAGEQGRRMDRFDPSAGEVMFVPQLRGG